MQRLMTRLRSGNACYSQLGETSSKLDNRKNRQRSPSLEVEES